MIESLILRIFCGLMIIWNWDSNVYLFILHPYVGWWYPAKGETIKQNCLDDRQICSLLVLHVFQLIGTWITRRMRTYETIHQWCSYFQKQNSPLIVIYPRNQHISTTYHIHFPYIYISHIQSYNISHIYFYHTTSQHQPHIDHILTLYVGPIYIYIYTPSDWHCPRGITWTPMVSVPRSMRSSATRTSGGGRTHESRGLTKPGSPTSSSKYPLVI